MKTTILTVGNDFEWPELQKEMIKKEGGVVIIFFAENSRDAEILNIFREHFLNIMERSAKGRTVMDCDWSKITEATSEDGSLTSQVNIHIHNKAKTTSSCFSATGEFMKILARAYSVAEDSERINKIHKKRRGK